MTGRILLVAASLLVAVPAIAQEEPAVYTRADTLRGDWTTPGRAWWDVTFYDLHIAISPSDSSISGHKGAGSRSRAPTAMALASSARLLRCATALKSSTKQH